ncbi:MAG: hypothetical protein HQM08_30030, partial [Candidatus Riflebacteria bacterium]|nr:hypothetical protein [Candidatus Riflebacteria bacterium]
NWTFTEGFLAALGGQPYVDLNNDGKITLKEFAEYIKNDMVIFEEQNSPSIFTNGFPEDFTLSFALSKSGKRIGERIEAFVENEWWKGRIIEENGGRYKIHYIGYNDNDDSWVEAKNLRKIATPKSYPVGTIVEVEWKKKWYPAKILDVTGGSHYITYDGYGEEWNEWVPTSRIRKPKK